MVVQAPAVGRPGAREPAGVTEARGEGAEAQAPGHGDRRGAIRRGAGAELTPAVVAPAVGRPGAREPAGPSVACGEGAEAQAPGDGDWPWSFRPQQ
jgi:hypothetical protein